MKKIIKLFVSSKITKILFAIAVFVICINVYTNQVVKKFDNSSPENAIAEYIYKANPTWKIFFMDVETVTVPDVPDYPSNYLYYKVKDNSIIGTPNNKGGTFKIIEIENNYFVVEYINSLR